MKTKVCTKCEEEKPTDSFSRNRWRKSGYNSWCGSCQKVYKDKHYRDNKSTYIKKAKVHTLETKKRINVLKDKPCKDCKKRFPQVCMDFDHVRGVKLFDIHSGYKARSWSAVLKEISKCELVCSNCHRIRTSKRYLCET